MAIKLVKEKKKAEGKAVRVVSEAEKLQGEVRAAFRDFANCWFHFAKKIAKVKVDEVWKELEYDSFKAYCTDEFPTVPFSTICKFTAVVESWGTALEQKMLKTPEDPLPSYDACYEIAAAEDKIPKEELPKLRKSVLDRAITRVEVRERLRSFTNKAASGLLKHEKAKLDKELKVAEKKQKEEAKAITEDLTDVKDTKADTQAQDLLARAKLLFDNLGPLTKKMTEASPRVVELAEFLRDNHEKFATVVDEFLTKVEKISNEE